MGKKTRGASQETEAIPSERGKRLLSVAAKLFRTKGYAGTKTREIAAVLGIQKASLYYHVRSKEDLLYNICLESLSRIRADVRASLDHESQPIERLRALIKTHVATALGDRDKHASMLFELRSLSDKRRREVLRMRDTYEDMVRDAVTQAQAAGAIRSDIPAKYLSLALLNLLNWSIFWFKPGGELTAQELGKILATVFVEGVGLNDQLGGYSR
jgi:AcrR family transcriptional regulator